MSQSFRAVAAAALLIGVLSGCGLPAPAPVDVDAEPEGQTVREACNELLPALLALNDDMTAAYDEVASDPTKASPLLRAVSADFRATIAELENEEVIEVTTTAVDSLDAMTDEIEKAVAGEQNSDALQAAMADVQTDFSAIDTVCAPD